MLTTRSLFWLGFLRVFVFHAVNGQDINPNMSNLQDTTDVVHYVHRVMIAPAVKNIRFAAKNDFELLRMLDLIKVEKTFGHHVGGQAYSTWRDGRPIVHIDLMFLSQCSNKADLAGILFSNPDEDVMFNVGHKYGEQLGVAVRNNEDLPLMDSEIENVGLNTAQIAAAEWFSVMALQAAVQFVILHEIGHHMLNHFLRDPVSLFESRQWELAADSWAIEKMKSIGFGIHPLSYIFLAFSIEENIQRMAGVIPDASQSDHPTWLERYANAEANGYAIPPSAGNWIALLMVESDLKTGKVDCNTLLIPRKSMPVPCTYQQFGKLINMPYESKGDGRVYVYGRDAIAMNKFTISQLDSIYPSIRIEYTDLRTGEKTISESTCYQFYVGFWSDNLAVKGLEGKTIRDALSLDPLEYSMNLLRKVETRPDVLKQARVIQMKSMIENNEILLRYAKGEIDLNTALLEMKAAGEINSHSLMELLGYARFEQFQRLTLADPLVNSAIENLQK